MRADPSHLALGQVYRWKAVEVRVPRPLEVGGLGTDTPVPIAPTPYQRPPVTLRAAAQALKVTEVMLISWLQDAAAIDVAALEAWRAECVAGALPQLPSRSASDVHNAGARAASERMNAR